MEILAGASFLRLVSAILRRLFHDGDSLSPTPYIGTAGEGFVRRRRRILPDGFSPDRFNLVIQL